MNTTMFDTLQVTENLKDAGIADARAIVTALHQATNEKVAMKADLLDLATKTDLKAEVAKLATKADLAAIKWILGFQSALIFIMASRLFDLF